MQSIIKSEQPSTAQGQPLGPGPRWTSALLGVMLVTMLGCHHRGKNDVCVMESNCVGYPPSGTAGFYPTCWSAWQDGPVGCVPAWAPPSSAVEEIVVPPGQGQPPSGNGLLPPVRDEAYEQMDEADELQPADAPEEVLEPMDAVPPSPE